MSNTTAKKSVKTQAVIKALKPQQSPVQQSSASIQTLALPPDLSAEQRHDFNYEQFKQNIAPHIVTARMIKAKIEAEDELQKCGKILGYVSEEGLKEQERLQQKMKGGSSNDRLFYFCLFAGTGVLIGMLWSRKIVNRVMSQRGIPIRF
jgi:hypothetical protein